MEDIEEKECSIDTATIIEILILAIIQGLTEWLPISSSGHLVIAQKHMGLSIPVFLDVLLHAGSLLVVLIVFRREIFSIVKAVAYLDFKSKEGKLALFVILGSIPTAVIGFAFKDLFESFFDNLWVVGIAFLLMGGFLFISEREKSKVNSLNHLDAILIGIAQCTALIPGISRSGVTITTGLLRRVGKQAAFTFSFLLFIPTVVGATVFKAVEAESLVTANIDPVNMLLGLVTTVIVGYFSLRLLRKIVLRERFHWFAYYCWVVGSFVLLNQVLAMS